MNITDNLLASTYRKHKTQFEGIKENFFAPLFIAKMHDRDVDDVLQNCIYGDNEIGIDGYYIEKEAKNLYLYKFEWTHNPDNFKDAFKLLVNGGLKSILTEYDGSSLEMSWLDRLHYTLEEYRDAISKVYIRFVFNGDVEKAHQSKLLGSLREDLESKKYLIDQYFKSDAIQFIIEYLSNTETSRLQASKTKKTHKYSLDFISSGVITAPGGESVHLGFVTMDSLRAMHEEMKHRLFEKNIRYSLDENKPTNRAIKKTLKDILVDKTVAPEYFTFNNNGVTLYVENLAINDSRLTVVEPRVLNGAQTIATYSRFIEEFGKKESISSRIKVLAKIIENGSSAFVTSVTIANNKQNPVDAINLRATDEIQFEFEDKFRNDLGIFYERQERAFVNFSDDELEEMGINETKELGIRKLAQTFLAIQGEIDKMSRLSEVFETDTLYHNTFHPDYLATDSRLLILLYKAHYRINAVIRDIIEKGHQKYWWASKAKNLIWALLLQGLLNDENLEALKESYGNNLSVPAEFTELLKDLGSKRLRFLLSDLVEQQKYSDYMEKAQYGFLRSKVAYGEVMQIARNRFDWQKKDI